MLCFCAEVSQAEKIAFDPPGQSEFIRDLAGLLDPSAQAEIRSTCKLLLEETDTTVFILTINSPADYWDSGSDIRLFSRQFVRQWASAREKTGAHTEKSKYVLFVVSKDKQEADIILGGAHWEPNHRETAIQTLQNVVHPQMRQGQYASGIKGGLEILGKISRGQNVSVRPLPWTFIACALGIILLIVFIVLQRRSARSRPSFVAPVEEGRMEPYRLIKRLREGGTYEIWEVINDNNPNPRFAMKVLLPEFCIDQNQVDLLKNDYIVGQLLDHPGMLKAYDFLANDKNMYLTMELYKFPNLKQLIAKRYKRLIKYIPTIIDQSAMALSYLHAQGWIHCDVKSDIFLIGAKGEVKMFDFALAQKREKASAEIPDLNSHDQSSLSYISPERICGEKLDERADIYSYGCVLYELLAGKPPFAANDAEELFKMHLETPPPSLQEANKNVTEEFARIVHKMLSKDPEERPASMMELLDAFKSLRVYRKRPEAFADQAQKDSSQGKPDPARQTDRPEQSSFSGIMRGVIDWESEVKKEQADLHGKKKTDPEKGDPADG